MDLVAEKVLGNFAQAGAVRIHYGDVGAGPPVICLHGTGPGADAWTNFRLNAGALAERHRTLLVDLPRFGRSEKVVVKGPRLDYLSGAIRAFLDALGIERAHFVGNSMGGQVAIKLAIDSPERVEKLVVIGSTPVGQSLFCPMPLEGIKMIANYYKGAGPSREKLRELLRTIVFDSSFLTEETFEERYKASTEPDVVELWSKKQPEHIRENLGPDLHKLKAKLLICWGMDDRFGALDVGLQMMRLVNGARMHIFSKCGHWAQVEHADAFNRLMLDFFGND